MPVWDNRPISTATSSLGETAVANPEVIALSVDVIIVAYNSAAEIVACLEAARPSPDVRRLIVVDNASLDGSAEAARSAGADVIIENGANLGFAAAVNQGLAACDSDYVLLLNPDAMLEGDALPRLLEALEVDDSVAMAGPMLVGASGKVVLGGRRFSTVVNRLLWHLPLPLRPMWSTPEYRTSARIVDHVADATHAVGRPLEVDYLWGAAPLVRRGFLEAIGGLDERFFLYSEDEDLGRNARLRGLRSVIVPHAMVRHVGGASSPDAAWAQARIEASNARLLAKWEGDLAERVFAAAIGPVLALRAVLLTLAGRRDEAQLAWRTTRLLGTARRMATDPTAAGPQADASRNGPGAAAGYALGTVRLAWRVIRRPGLVVSGPRLDAPLGLMSDDPAPEKARESTQGTPSVPGTPPLVSVIMPVYNAERVDSRHLTQALESVAGQSFRRS